MPVQYGLQPNPATPDPNDQSARVITTKNRNEDYIAAQMVQRGVFPTAGASLSALITIQEIIGQAVADGDAINLPLFTLRPGIQGVFTDVNDTFDLARHVLRANFQMGPLLRELMAKATVEKVLGTDAVPHIVSFVNENTGALNATITPGGIGQDRGEQLKFGDADTEGPFFVNLATNVATRATVVPKRFEGELMFLCPNLPPGQYRHEVRRLYGGNKDQMRIGHLNVILTVA